MVITRWHCSGFNEKGDPPTSFLSQFLILTDRLAGKVALIILNNNCKFILYLNIKSLKSEILYLFFPPKNWQKVIYTGTWIWIRSLVHFLKKKMNLELFFEEGYLSNGLKILSVIFYTFPIFLKNHAI